MKGLKLTILLLLVSGLSLKSQENENRANEGFKLGNADLIALQLSEVVELNIPAAEGTFSRDASHKHLISFFNQHAIKSFEIIHKGEASLNASYQIGQLETSQGPFRVYLLYSNQSVQKISELRIEVDE